MARNNRTVAPGEKRAANISEPREVFSIRFSASEVEKLRTEAQVRGSTLAGLVREVVMESVHQPRARVIVLGAGSTSPTIARFYGGVADHGPRSET